MTQCETCGAFMKRGVVGCKPCLRVGRRPDVRDPIPTRVTMPPAPSAPLILQTSNAPRPRTFRRGPPFQRPQP